jgi:predicted DsbA family dithiol-disulfide isomerase
MHKLMMSKQDSLENLSSYAASLNLDSAKFEECMRSNKYKEEVSQDAAIAQKLGINGVPGFIIASIDPQNPKKVKGISFIRGALPFANFQKELDSALASQ